MMDKTMLLGMRWGVLEMLAVLSQLLILPQGVNLTFAQASPQCTAGIPHSAIGQEWVYTAPRRFVPPPPVDPALQMEFFQLFMSYSNETKFAVSQEPIPPGITQQDFDYIASICPKDAFFYSMSPTHVVGRTILQQYLSQLPTPREVLRVSRIILYTQEINAKIWYYAVMGAVLERPDMSGMMVPQPLDVLPDQYVPAPVLSDILSRYKVVYGIGDDLGHPGPGRIAGPVAAPASLFSRDGPSFSYQHVAQSSSLAEHRIKFDRRSGDGVNGNNNSTGVTGRKRKRNNGSGGVALIDSGTASNSNGKGVRYRRVKKPRNQNAEERSDNPGAESISHATVVKADHVQFRSPNMSLKSVSYKNSAEDIEPVSLIYGEEDDEFDELKKIVETSTNSTRQITERILQRRQRRKKKKTKVKRQVFGSPFHNQAPIRDCVIINGTIGASNGPENKLWYWREDLMVNQHHWYWHQMYPVNATRHGDRRAELFFFTHRNIVARYNAERLSNGMPRTHELLLRHGSYIEDGYNSFLIDMAARKFWTPREPHVALTDIIHTQDPDFQRNVFLKDVDDIYHKLIFSIKDGHLLAPNLQPVPIRNYQGIDKLANTIEASELSINPLYYDSFGIHNLGHQILGLAQDPQFVAGLPIGVMGDTGVTMRDPVFYTFHSGVDNLFDKYKRTLPPYQLYEGDFPLVWPGVAITSVLVLPSLSDGHNNHIRTFFSTDRFPLESGIDNSIHNGQIKEDVCALHLDHEPFTYKISIAVNPCVPSATGKGTVRVFMAPRYDEYGARFPLKVQRRLMFQLDSFPVVLRSGANVIIRRSEDSALTKPWPMSLRQQAFQGQNRGQAEFCGCGWPRHLLIPKGTPQGMQFDLFVMITNFDEDFVQDSPQDLKVPEGCTSPHIMCGIPWRRFPDARPMGYPFDRLPYKIPVNCRSASGFPDIVCKMIQSQWYKSPETLEEYVHPVPNMAATVVNIQHFDTIVN